MPATGDTRMKWPPGPCGPRRRILRWPIVLTAALLLAACAQTAEVLELSGETMGTRFSVQLSPAPPAADRSRLQGLIEQRLQAINTQMSTYLPASDLRRFNDSRSTDWQPVPADLAALVARAQAISELTGGRYDITIGPLVDLWGFGSGGDRDRPPTDPEIAALLPQIGYRQLSVRATPPALRKQVPELAIDLSSIAKGWAVDQLSALLLDEGFPNHLVEIGGETRGHGSKADGRPWRIAVEQPDSIGREVLAVLTPGNDAIATSGDYRNYFEHEGQRYSHTLDPRTGRTVRHRLASVTVLAETCSDADAWATALMALGDEAGPALADRLSLRALFVIREPEGFRVLPSAAWPRDLTAD
jgi:thiamine biosynthesis lipoprotein